MVKQVGLHVAHLAIECDSELVNFLVHVLLDVFIIDSAHTRTTASAQSRHLRRLLLDAHLATHTAPCQHPQIVPHPGTSSYCLLGSHARTGVISHGVLPRKVGPMCVNIADIATASFLNNIVTCLKL